MAFVVDVFFCFAWFEISVVVVVVVVVLMPIDFYMFVHDMSSDKNNHV